MLPTDDDGWLVYADQLIERGDERGELIVLEHSDRELGALAADDWATSMLEGDNLDAYRWIRSLAPLANPPTPAELVPVFATPISHLLAGLDLEGAWSDDVIAPVFEDHRMRVIAATLAWIDRAFDGVPVPDEDHRTIYQAEAADNYDGCDRSRDHLGRWQDLPDQHLLDNQWALPHLDPHGIPYYVPAVMSFGLRRLERVDHDYPWILENLGYSLQPSKRDLRSHQQGRLARLDRLQRAAIYAYTLVARVDGTEAWAAVFEGEHDGERDDWFELFNPA